MRNHVVLFILIGVVGLVFIGFTLDAKGAAEGTAPRTSTMIISDTPAYPYDAEITGNDVNIRSGPGVSYYPCIKLNKGEKVRIVGGDQGGLWSKIQPPKGSFSWISMKYVEIDPADQTIGTVTGNDVRVYAGSDFYKPEVLTGLQGKLNKGEKVTLLGEQLNNYYKIKVPALPDAYLWISTQYTKPIPPEAPKVNPGVIDPIKPNDDTNPSTPPVGTAPGAGAVEPNSAVIPEEANEPTPLQKFYDLQKQFDAERVKPLNEQDYSSIKEGLQEIIEDKNADKAARYAKVIAGRIDGIELALEVDKVVKQQNEQLKQATEKIDAARAKKLAEIQNLGRFAVVGVLQNFLVLGAGNYRIVDETGKTICHAVPEDSASGMDLSAFIGKKVGLIGTIESHSQTSGALVRFSNVVPVK